MIQLQDWVELLYYGRSSGETVSAEIAWDASDTSNCSAARPDEAYGSVSGGSKRIQSGTPPYMMGVSEKGKIGEAALVAYRYVVRRDLSMVLTSGSCQTLMLL